MEIASAARPPSLSDYADRQENLVGQLSAIAAQLGDILAQVRGVQPEPYPENPISPPKPDCILERFADSSERAKAYTDVIFARLEELKGRL